MGGSPGDASPHSPTLISLHLRHISFSIPSAALPTSQLVLQTFRCFTYVIGTSPTSQLILQSFRHFIYITAHSTTLPLLHLRHSSFSNPSNASPTTQVILQPIRCFTYVTGTSRTSPGEPPMHRGDVVDYIACTESNTFPYDRGLQPFEFKGQFTSFM